MREREIIRKYFNYAAAASIKVGIGDDAAVVANAKNRKLAISTDTLVAGVHFRADDRPFFLARKAAAVSLSDMAAMGARPLWMTVSITFGGGNNAAKWFAAIGKGFADSARLPGTAGTILAVPLYYLTFGLHAASKCNCASGKCVH